MYCNILRKLYTLSEFISCFDYLLFQTEILSKQKEESLEKEVVELKAMLRDLEDKLKKSENRSFEMLGTVQRLNSRPVLSDSETDDVAIEKRNAGKS
jgi:translation initiation factor 2B subunit (eIF-2B alpha/beta/delta family)